MLLIAVGIEELLVDGVALRMFHRPPHYALHSFGHCRIEHQIAGEDGNSVPFDDVPYLEERVSALQPQCLSLGGKGNDIAIIAREHAHGLSFQAWVQRSFHRSEEDVAIGEAIII